MISTKRLISIVIFSLCIKHILPNALKFMASNEIQDTKCYNLPDTYKVLQVNDNLTKTDNNIFFLETSCRGGLNSRQACSVESAARANPDWNIFVLLTSPIDVQHNILKNIKYARIYIRDFTRGTKLENLFSSGILFKSRYPVMHASDVLRYLILNKFGGVYLDLDVLVTNSFKDLPENFVTQESETFLAAGVIRCSKDSVGKRFTNLALDNLKYLYVPWGWCQNGPCLVQRVMDQMDKMCPQTMTKWQLCKGMEVIDPKTFFPYGYNIDTYYEDRKIENTGGYGHHIWNTLGHDNEIKPNSLYAKLAKKYCPSVYKMYGDYFGQ